MVDKNTQQALKRKLVDHFSGAAVAVATALGVATLSAFAIATLPVSVPLIANIGISSALGLYCGNYTRELISRGSRYQTAFKNKEIRAHQLYLEEDTKEAAGFVVPASVGWGITCMYAVAENAITGTPSGNYLLAFTCSTVGALIYLSDMASKGYQLYNMPPPIGKGRDNGPKPGPN